MHVHYHLHHLRFIRSELSEIYINIAMQIFALSLFTVFIPIYLLEKGFALNEVMIFLLVQYVIAVISAPLAAMLASKFGLKHVMILRTPMIIIYLAGLYYLDVNSAIIYPIAALIGFSESFYWISFNGIFARFTHKKKRSKEVGDFWSISSISAILSPFAGGLLAEVAGFGTLFVIASVLLLVSVVPLFFTPDMKPSMRLNFMKGLDGKCWRYFAGFFCEGFRSATYIIFWPLYVYFVLHEVSAVGLMSTATSIGILATTFLLSGMANGERKKYLKVGGVFMAIIWIWRIYSMGFFDMLILSVFGGFFSMMILMPFESMSYDKAQQIETEQFIMMRDMSINLGRAAMVILAFLAVQTYAVTFAGAALGSLFFSFF